MTPAEIRAKYWSLRNKLQEPGKIVPTLDLQIQLLQVELQAEMAACCAEIKEVLQRSIGTVNFELLALRMDVLFEKLSDDEKQKP